MKHKEFIIFYVIILILISCQSYDDYIDYQGYTMNDVLVQGIDDIISTVEEDPLELLDYILMMEPTVDTIINSNGDTICIYSSQDNIEQWNTVEKQTDYIIDCFSSEKIKRKNELLKTNEEYRNWFVYSSIEELSLVLILFKLIPKTSCNVPKGVVLNNTMTRGKIIRSAYINSLGKINIPKGNKYFGWTHVVKKHGPKYYVSNGLKPNKHCSLFLSSDEAYINNLLNKFSKNCKEIKTLNNNRAFISKIKVNNTIGYRQYIAVVDGNNNLVTFFPKGTISQKKIFSLKKNPTQRKKYKNYIYLRWNKY